MPKPHKIKIPSDTTADAAPQGPPGAQPAAAQPTPTEAVAEPAEERIRRLEEQFAEADERATELNDKYLRAVADIENHRRRARQERAEATRSGEAAILLEVLPVLDNFTRALEAAEDSRDVAALITGVRMSQEQLLQALARKGVHPIAAEGKPFDPAYHDAVGELETTEQPEGTVVLEVQKGYMLGDRVLRPSRVMVAVRPVGTQEPEREEP